MFKRITIIGLGLIGGSLGLAIKHKRLARKVIGVSRRRTTILRALSIGAVDSVTLDLKKGVEDSDLIILTVPVLKIMDLAGHIAPALKKGAIVIDAGSTKNEIVKNIESVLSGSVDFVGTHPLAGSELSGVIYARRDLFKGAYCILTKTRRTDKKALGKVKRFWRALGMKVEVMSPEKHDKCVSRLSHLPHAVSVALSNASRKEDLRLAAGGFKDTTRIAAGSPELWKDIFITNKKNIAADIRILKKELSKIEAALKKGSSSELLRLFKKAKVLRDSL
ncbi:MAG: prephenate dehydrogenase [Candidatus Omnitrophica bacterium]|nr:prephenate dehydrogenase [Candidatus Omnitrophota bacterium]